MTMLTRNPASGVTQAVLTVLAALLYAVGWASARAVLTVLWVVAAVRVGWSDATNRAG